MNWGESFWVWFITEAIFGAFVAALLYYFFVYKQRKIDNKDDKKK